MQDFFAGYEYLAAHPGSTGKVGASASATAAASATRWRSPTPSSPPRCRSTAARPTSPTCPAIEAPLLLHYAGLDERVNAGWPAYEAALKANGKVYEAYIYEGANHGFHNDTTPALRRGGGDARLGAARWRVRRAIPRSQAA